VLFSIAFLAASTLVVKYKVRNSLLISAIAVSILFGCMEISTLQWRLYPPFGLVTEAFMPIGAFLVFTGIIRSAELVAHDSELRREFYNTAKSQLTLLKTVGVAQMENELIKKYKSIDKRARSLDEDSRFEKDNVKEALHGLVDELDKEKAREMLHDVLTELYSKAKPEAKS
jgi:hypothetical protein